MSVRFDASADALSRTANLPPIGTFTITGWGYRSVDRGSFETLFAFGPGSGSSYYQLFVNSSDQFRVWNGTGSSAGTTVLSTGTWYHLALVVEGTGTNQCKSYLDGVLNTTTDGNAALTAGKLWLANDNDTEWLNGRLCAVKIYDVALTAAEVAQEMHGIRPTRFADLNGWYPTFPGSGERGRDYSGSGRDFTEEGTLTDEDPAPVSWSAPVLLLPFAAATAAAASVLPRRNPMRLHLAR